MLPCFRACTKDFKRSFPTIIHTFSSILLYTYCRGNWIFRIFSSRTWLCTTFDGIFVQVANSDIPLTSVTELSPAFCSSYPIPVFPFEPCCSSQNDFLASHNRLLAFFYMVAITALGCQTLALPGFTPALTDIYSNLYFFILLMVEILQHISRDLVSQPSQSVIIWWHRRPFSTRPSGHFISFSIASLLLLVRPPQNGYVTREQSQMTAVLKSNIGEHT